MKNASQWILQKMLNCQSVNTMITFWQCKTAVDLLRWKKTDHNITEVKGTITAPQCLENMSIQLTIFPLDWQACKDIEGGERKGEKDPVTHAFSYTCKNSWLLDSWRMHWLLCIHIHMLEHRREQCITSDWLKLWASCFNTQWQVYNERNPSVLFTEQTIRSSYLLLHG